MQIRYLNKKWVLSELDNLTKMSIRRTAVNVVTKGSILELEDNIFNRALLGQDLECKEPFSVVKAASINPEARVYQNKDIAHMLVSKQTLNRNKPGYGKTFETIEYCRIMGFKRILIICPKSVTHQWKEQFARWWPEVEQLVKVGGLGPDRGETSIFVTNYEQMLRDQVWQQCKQWTWDIIVCDESHRIKNPKAKVTMRIKQLPAIHKMPLTGTPILSHPNDLWSQLNFMGEYYSGRSYWAFTERFCEIEDNHFGKKIIGLTPSEASKDLLARILNIITVGGENQKLTEGKNTIVMELEMDKPQRSLYRDIVNLSLDRLNEQGITIKNAMDQIVKQQQVTTNCCKFTKQESDDKLGTKTIICPRNPKFEWIKDWLEDNAEEKLIVFTKYAETAKSLQQYLSKNKIVNAIYIGEMSGTARAASKEKYVQQPAVRVLIGTIGAMGTGVDGLQDVCRNVVFLDRDWTPGINEQAEQRVDRPSEKWKDKGMTNIWILHMKNSIDKYVEGINTKKDKDIKEIFERVNNCT